MRGSFVTWGMGAVCVPLIALSAFVLALPSAADGVLFSSSEVPPPPPVPSIERVPVSLNSPDCAVVGTQGMGALRLDGTPVALGAGTVLEGKMSVRGRTSYRAKILNGPHAGAEVELDRQSSAVGFQWEWSSYAPLWACTWAADAELSGLWIDARVHRDETRTAIDNETEGVLWNDADDEVAELMYWAWQAPERARRREEMTTWPPMTNGQAHKIGWLVTPAIRTAVTHATWLDRIGSPEPAEVTGTGELASLR